MASLSSKRAVSWIVVANAGLGAVAALLGSCTTPPDPPTPRVTEHTNEVQQAATGVCDSNPPTTTLACINAVQSNASVVNEIFSDSNGLTALQLPLFGKLYNNWPNCPDVTNFAGCAGQSLMPFDCPGQYTCLPKPNNFATASEHVNKLDRLWWHPCRLANAALVNGCPQFTGGCVADGNNANYLPWEGPVFDLGGPSNKVVIFAQNDHGPQPCESLEYTVYLSDNPLSQELIKDPKATGVDPKKWNRAVLSKVFTKGWVEVRPPDPIGHAACGDTDKYSVEEDSYAQVFSLPCGITFRYAAIIAGNDGLDFPACAFDSSEAELDAVAGLTEAGSGVCPDVDGDHYVDCKCKNAPKVCDCDDNAVLIHPGAPEPCDSVDVNCDGLPGACESPLVCNASICVPKCDGEAVACPKGANCTSTPNGKLCVPGDCSVGGCPAGSVCNAKKVCVPACDGVVCPGKQICQDGHCIDPCLGVDCPPGHFCQVGKCQAPCNCFAGDAGCDAEPGTVCDQGGTNLCTPPACKGKMCPPGQQCDASGNCVGFCNANVKCPAGQKCVEPTGCVPLCQAVTCGSGTSCNPDTGKCEDHACDGVICFAPQVCKQGVCVTEMGATSSATTSAGAGAGANDTPVANGACGCRVVGGTDETAGAAAALAACAVIVSRRRRRSPTRGTSRPPTR